MTEQEANQEAIDAIGAMAAQALSNLSLTGSGSYAR
jgi:hypothetical protein